MDTVKVGLYFGSFNPIHIGHLMIGAYIKENLDIDEVWFVLSPQNPLKDKELLTNEAHRLKMLELAVENETAFKCSDIEFHLSKPSYTINTLNYLSELHKNCQFYLIIGTDNLALFHKWKNADEIMEKYNVIVYPRSVSVEKDRMLNYHNVQFIDAPLIDISSTEIREYAKNNKILLTQFLPKRVAEYIMEQGLYGL